VRVAVERIRSSVHEIKSSGLTLSKLSVAASLLGDLVRQEAGGCGKRALDGVVFLAVPCR
jgi:hypothetical protein